MPLGLVLALLLLAALAAPPAEASPATSTCAEGPTRVGDTIVGTPCADHIVAPPGVAKVEGGAGNDTIVAAPIASIVQCGSALCLGVGSQTFEGGPGDDIVFGERGNDILRGNEGDDKLYGGIGDDLLEGGPGNDLLSGGFGADTIDGGEGDDYVRGDGTIDHIYDRGGGFDTLSYSTGIAPGFGGGIDPGAKSFPPAGTEGERGVYLDLSGSELNGNDGIAALGGGVDDVQPNVFERIIGTPYSDYIVGSGAGEEIYGGGGADVIRGGGGEDKLYGGADGDLLEGGAGSKLDGEGGQDNCVGAGTEKTSCEGSEQEVKPRETSKVSVGMTTGSTGFSQVYLTGSDGSDDVKATYSSSPTEVTFTLTSGTFDTSEADEGDCLATPTEATCPLGSLPLDSIVLAGMGGNDSIEAAGFPQTTGVIVTGGTGDDHLTGGETEDVLVDGPGSGTDTLEALGGDDALLHNGGADTLRGGAGNDLFLSVSICDGETLEGGPDRDNSSWARLPKGAVEARIYDGQVGAPGVGIGNEPECQTGSLDEMREIEDLEGSGGDDVLYGDAGPNQLLGHGGSDFYFSLAGEDSILANSGDSDAVIDCGADYDSAIIDIPHPGEYEDPEPIECERVGEAEPNNFQDVTELPRPVIEEAPPPDTTPPRTKITWHPARLLRLGHRHRRRVSFRFVSDEPASRFRCRFDLGPYRNCTSPRAYRAGAGHHVFRVFAVDAAGNRDPSPARFGFQVRRRVKHARARHHRPDRVAQ